MADGSSIGTGFNLRPYAGEYHVSHWLRAMCVTGNWDSSRTVRNDLNAGLTRVEFGAACSAIELPNYLREHSAAGFEGIFAKRPSVDVALDAFSRELRFCQRCADRDVEERGITIFRRHHHIRGINWCMFCKNTLVIADCENGAWFTCPTARRYAVPSNIESDIYDHPVVNAYVAMAEWLINANLILQREKVADAMRAYTWSKFMMGGLAHMDRLAMEFYERNVPLNWLRGILTGPGTTKLRARYTPMDAVNSGSPIRAAAAFCFFGAMHFGTFQEFTAWLEKQHIGPVRMSISSI